MALLHIFANLSNILLNRIQLKSHTCLCIQSVAIPHVCSLWKTLLNTCKGMGIKKANNAGFIIKVVWLYRSPQVTNEAPRVLRYTALKDLKAFPRHFPSKLFSYFETKVIVYDYIIFYLKRRIQYKIGSPWFF